MLKKIFGKIFKSADERAAEDEEYFKRTANKNYRPDEDKPKFADDYFKSSDDAGEKKEQQGPAWQKRREQREQAKAGNSQQQASTEEENTEAQFKKTYMGNGITIIDQRDSSHAGRKIFAPTEGEYVEFTEE